MAEPLRVVLRPGRGASAPWQRRCIEELARLSAVEVVAALVDDAAHEPDLAGVARLARRDLGALERLAPDVVLDLATATPDWALAACTRHGLWAFAHQSGPASADLGTFEILRGRRAVPVRLVRFGPRPQAIGLLEEGCFKAVRHSLGATRARINAAIATWPRRHLARLARAPAALAPVPTELWPAPRPLARRLLPLAQLRNLVDRLAEETIEEQWSIGLVERPLESLLDGFEPAAVRWLAPPPGGYWADPWGLVEGERRFVLAEAYEFADRRGHVVVLELKDPGRPRVVGELRLPAHLSYPQVLRHDGAIFCLPEAYGRGELRLFRAAPFPHRWLPDRVLLEGFAAVDATLFEHAGRWWLLCGNHADQDETKLYVFHAPALFGPWQAHTENPVKCDLRSSRPAGAPFVVGGQLYRPAQDCSATYGGAIAINRVERLAPEHFAERMVAVLRPDPAGPYPHGMHMLSRLGEAVLIDGKRHRRSLRRLGAGLRRLWQEARPPAA